jgi:hypothetical protein
MRPVGRQEAVDEHRVAATGVAARAPQPRRSKVLAVGALLLVCTLGVRLPGALHDALWQDEVGTEHVIAQTTLGDALHAIVHRESTPPAFYLLARAADRLAPSSTPASRVHTVRVLPLAFSLGCTALTFALALELLPLWGAALAGLLVSFGSILVVHGSELRSYPLLAFASVAFAITLENAAARPRSPARLALLSGAVALGSLTHYFFLFTLAAGVVWLLVSDRRRGTLVRVGAAVAVGLVPLAVWSPWWLRQYRNGIYGTAPRPFDLGRVLDLFPSLFAPQAIVNDTSLVTHSVLSLGALLPIAVTLVVLVPSALLLRSPKGRLCGILVLVPFVVITTMVAVTGERVFSSRNLIGITPFAAIAVAWGCVSLPWRRAEFAAGALVGAVVIAGYAYGEIDLGRTPYDRIAAALTAQGLHAGEPIVWYGSWGGHVPVGWYLRSGESADAESQLVVARPTSGSCTAVEVVARTDSGRAWLAGHGRAVIARASFPSYGDVLQGSRNSDVIVARLRWSPRILERPPGSTNRFLFRLAETRSPCVRS